MAVAVVGSGGVPQDGGDGGDGLRYRGAAVLTRAAVTVAAVTVTVTVAAVAVVRSFGGAAFGAWPGRERRCGARSGFVRWPDVRPGGRFGGRRLGGAGRAVGRGLVRHGVREARGEA
ncbi:hypothetical protein AB0M38_12315 [Streptomyces sp. NPDC051742]|uniref:hypothetical protein n=1 Tax=unclassified Streptomyces TaxID=2593676 RepID=UPI00343C5431